MLGRKPLTVDVTRDSSTLEARTEGEGGGGSEGEYLRDGIARLRDALEPLNPVP